MTAPAMTRDDVCTGCATGSHLSCVGAMLRGGPRSKGRMVDCACKASDHTLVGVNRDDDLAPVTTAVTIDPAFVRPLSTMAAYSSGAVPRFLRHLATDKRGFPILWVADWTAERDGDGVPWAQADLRSLGCPYPSTTVQVSQGKQGDGAPLLARLNPVRQRRAMVERLCQVCGKRINHSEPGVFIGGPSLVHTGWREPGMHRRCAAYSLYACPGINRSDVIVVESRTWTLLPECLADPTGESRMVQGEWLRPQDGFLVYLLAKPDTDAVVHVNPVVYRDLHAPLLGEP